MHGTLCNMYQYIMKKLFSNAHVLGKSTKPSPYEEGAQIPVVSVDFLWDEENHR